MKSRLKSYKPEKIGIMVQANSPPDALGQVTQSWQAGPEVLARVQPVSDEQATQMQLKSKFAALNAWLPPDTVLAPYDRVMYDGKRWHVRSVERWQSYLRAVLEEVHL